MIDIITNRCQPFLPRRNAGGKRTALPGHPLRHPIGPQPRRQRLQALRRVEVAQHRVVRHLDLGDRLHVLAQQRAGAGIAGDLRGFRGRTRGPTASGCPACRGTSAPRCSRPSSGRRRRSAGRSCARSPAACRPGTPCAAAHVRAAARRCRPSGWPTGPRRNPAACTKRTGRPAERVLGSRRPGGRSRRAPAGRRATARCPPPARSSACRRGRRPAACCAAPSGASVPAASTTAATWRGARRDAVRGVAGAFARGSGRTSMSFSRPPTPMRMISAGPTGSPANRRVSTKSMPFSFGLRAQPGNTRAGRVADPAEADQVAGIHRHAEMQDLAAGAHDRPPGRRRAGPPPPRRRRPAAGRRPGGEQLPQRGGDRRPRRAGSAAAAAACRRAGDARLGRRDGASR